MHESSGGAMCMAAGVVPPNLDDFSEGNSYSEFYIRKIELLPSLETVFSHWPSQSILSNSATVGIASASSKLHPLIACNVANANTMKVGSRDP